MRVSQLATFERRLVRERAYWLSALEGTPEPAELPLDFARPAACAPGKLTVPVPLTVPAARAAAVIAHDEAALAFVVVVSALDLCLRRYTGRTDVVIGTCVPDHMAGSASFNDLVPLRLRTPAAATTRQALEGTRDLIREALRHARYPFERLVDLLALPRVPNRTPLVSIAVIQEELSSRKLLDGSITDIVVVGRVTDGALSADVEYDPRLFAPATIETFAAHLARTLEWQMGHLDSPIDALALMSRDEQEQAIYGFNATDTPFPEDAGIHVLFEQQVDRAPDRVAATSQGRSLTYRELDLAANRLAHVLAGHGVGPGSRVGILLPHSVETVAAVLGVLKAGAAYVPLDVDHPPLRIGFALDDAGVGVVVTTSGMAGLVGGSRLAVRVDADRELLASAPEARPGRAAERDAEAYVIYTSGSTGRPKGVAVPHRALVNYIWWARSAYVGGRSADFALHSSLAFDLTVTSVFTPLLTGGAVVAYPAHAGAPSVMDVLRDNRVDVIKLTPGHLALLAEQRALPSRLRTLIVGGENLDAVLSRRVHELSGGRVEIYNEYGPTETTVGCMIHRFDAVADRRRAVPIGVPAANTRIYVLDAAFEPVSPNGAGELYVGGAGLAVGYVGQPALTADRFIPNLFRPGERMYRTGDLARRLPEGTIAFLGRRDDEVKVRGHRIDLGEVRASVVGHPQVRDCVVRRLEDEDGSSVLVACYVARQPVDESELRAFVRDRLVDAAVPGAFVFLRRLPLTLNGKVDLRALPGLDVIARQSVRTIQPPRTPTEQAIAEIWRGLLKTDAVGVHDNFFELGGHSLIATQVVSRLRDALGVELPLRTIFEHPTIAALATRIDGTGVAAAGGTAITQASRDTPLPLSFAQQRLWFLDQLDPGSAVYNIAGRLRIDGPLDPETLRASLDAVIARHEALRTSFPEDGGRPVQTIADPLRLDCPVVDLPGSDPAMREGAAARAAAEEGTRPFDLRTGPLVRATLLRLAPDAHVLLLTLHHSVADGWSLRILARELSALYTAALEGRALDLPALPIQYADYAVWQRQSLTGARLDSELTFWREALAGAPVLELPTDRPRPAVQAFRGAALPIELSRSVTDGVRRASLALDGTPFMTLLAGYAAVLHRWSGQPDLVIGSPIANRTRPEIEGLIGFFANTLVLRVRLDGNPTFAELLASVKSVVLDASAHQELPFERLVEDLQPERALSYNPLFQVMFGLNASPTDAISLPGLRFTPQQSETGTAKFDLNLLMDDDGDRLTGVLEYNVDLFDEATVVRLRSHLETLLAGALADPSVHVADLPIMPASERRRVLVEWNATSGAITQRCAHELVEATAARAPDRLAAVFPGEPDETLTYRELNESANRLAHHLRTAGVGPDVPVALCLERSLQMAVAVLAVLKAGGAYVPLDPAYPRERLAQMLDDTRAPVIVGHAATRDRLPRSDFARVIWLDADSDAIAAQPASNPESGVSPENLLYVIYTSGSTGRPKGIALSHRALVNLIRWNLDTLAEGEGVLQFASLGFDASFHEMFAAWGSGRYLAMIPEHWRRDPSELLTYLERWPVETAILPGVVLHQWADGGQGRHRALATLRHLVATGEQLVVTQPIVELFRQLPQCRLHNHYGPSETHVVTALTLDADPQHWVPRPSIGCPILNSSIFILDARLNPTPTGVTGELYIGGTNLARGYLNRPDLTAARFIPHPFADSPGERLYTTGDLARWQTDGTIEFLGRLDDQVKIRGFRVELGDVESTLNQHPDVSQSVVVSRDGVAGRRLVAYVVAVPGRTLTGDALRGFALRLLPDYMVPSAFVVLDAVKLTANGKVDRRALPAPPDDRPELAHAFVDPSGPAEELMAELWQQVLGIRRVGARDNFFHIGGHSLIATQLVSRVRRTFDLDLQLKTVFESPTVTGLVDALGRLAGDRALVDEIALAVRAVDAMTADEVRALLTEAPVSDSR